MPKVKRQAPKDATNSLTTNQVVSYNFIRAREENGWTQAQASNELYGFLGYHLNQAGISTIERTFDGGRDRNFSADEILAFARCFKRPVTYFFLPPVGFSQHWLNPIEGFAWARTYDVLAHALGLPEGWEALLERIRELLDKDRVDTWDALRYAFHDRSDGYQPADVLDEWVIERRRQLQVETLQRLASEVDARVHALSELVRQLEATTVVGLLIRAQTDPSILESLVERPTGTGRPAGEE